MSADIRRRAGWLAILPPMLALWVIQADAAPAPFPRTPPSYSHRLHASDLVGTWEMTWAGSRWTVTLTATGDYACRTAGLEFVGSWGLDGEGRFWIKESSRPSDPESWKSYSVRLCPRTLQGRTETGSPGTEVRLLRTR